MPSPVRLRRHGQPHARNPGLAYGLRRAGTPGVIAADNASARLDLDNEPQPDALLMIDPESRRPGPDLRRRLRRGGPRAGRGSRSPAAVSIDLHNKLHVYRRSGVREYVVWRVQDRKIDWFVLRDGEFIRLDPDEKGHYRSHDFPGLWLDATALVAGDMAKVLDVVRQGLAAPEHAKFVSDLAARSSSPRP